MVVRHLLVAVVLAAVGLWLGQDGDIRAQQATGRAQTFTATARVVAVLEEGITTVGPVTQPYQRLLVELTSGPEKGQRVEVSVGVRDLNTAGQRFAPGNRLFLSVSTGPDGSRAYTVLDRDRSTPLAVLGVLFAGAIVALGRWKGCAHFSASRSHSSFWCGCSCRSSCAVIPLCPWRS